MNRIAFLRAVCLFGVLVWGTAGAAASHEQWRERLQSGERPEWDKWVQQLRSMTETERKEALVTLAEMANAEAVTPRPSSRLVRPIAYILREVGDEATLMSALAEGIQRMELVDQAYAADALTACKSEAAAKAIDAVVRAHLSAWGPLPDETPIEAVKKVNREAGDVLGMVTALAQTAPPHGRVLAVGIVKEMEVKSKQSGWWKKIYGAIDASLQEAAKEK